MSESRGVGLVPVAFGIGVLALSAFLVRTRQPRVAPPITPNSAPVAEERSSERLLGAGEAVERPPGPDAVPEVDSSESLPVDTSIPDAATEVRDATQPFCGVPQASPGWISARLVDSTGLAVPRAWLRIDGGGAGSWFIRTDDDGSFALRCPSPDARLNVAIEPSAFDAASTGPSLHAGDLRTTYRNAQLRVDRALAVVANGTIHDVRGDALVGWTVAARREDQPSAQVDDLVSAKSDANGRFRLVAWRNAKVDLEAYSTSGARRTIAMLDMFRGDAWITVAPLGLSGHVVTPRGRPVAGAKVRARSRESGEELLATTDASGWFEMTDVSGSTVYDLWTRCDGRWSRALEWTPDAGDARLVLRGPGE